MFQCSTFNHFSSVITSKRHLSYSFFFSVCQLPIKVCFLFCLPFPLKVKCVKCVSFPACQVCRQPKMFDSLVIGSSTIPYVALLKGAAHNFLTISPKCVSTLTVQALLSSIGPSFSAESPPFHSPEPQRAFYQTFHWLSSTCDWWIGNHINDIWEAIKP